MQLLPCAVLTIVAGGLVALACNRESPPAAQEARAPSAPVEKTRSAENPTTPASTVTDTPSPAPPLPQAGADRYSEANFELSVRPSGAYESGKEGKIEIVLDAKPPFHVNKQYPYKFKSKEGPGVKFPEPVVGKDRAKLEEQRVTMPVAFVPASAGKHNVSGQFAFSVCTDETCLMEKRELSLAVDVK